MIVPRFKTSFTRIKGEYYLVKGRNQRDWWLVKWAGNGTSCFLQIKGKIIYVPTELAGMKVRIKLEMLPAKDQI